jgi:hypothetical protein
MITAQLHSSTHDTNVFFFSFLEGDVYRNRLEREGGNQGGVISKSRRREEKNIHQIDKDRFFVCVCILKSISDTHFHNSLYVT